MATKRMTNPEIKRIEQNTLEKTVSANYAVAPTATGSGNCMGSSPDNVENLSIPRVNIKILTARRSSIITKKLIILK